MYRGYLPIWRKFFEHPFWCEKRKFSKAEAWIDILQNTHFRDEPQQRIIAGKMFQIEYGECVMSTRYCARRWGWSQSAVVRFWRTLVTLSQIRKKSTRGPNHLIICNFSKYDPRRLNSDSNVTHGRLTDDSPATQTKRTIRTKELKRTRKYTPPTPPNGGNGKKSEKQKCPINKIIDLYHSILPELPAVTEITEILKKHIRARWKEHPDLLWFEWYFKGVADCPFLMGQKKGMDFMATLHWLMGPQNMTKVLSGQYLSKSKIKEAAAKKAFIDGT